MSGANAVNCRSSEMPLADQCVADLMPPLALQQIPFHVTNNLELEIHVLDSRLWSQ